MIVLTLDPLLFGVTALSGPIMARVCKKFAVTNGRTRVRVPTMANLNPQCLVKGADALDDLIARTEDDVAVLAWSQGAMIATEWLLRDQRHTPTASLEFIFIGNPLRGASRGGASGRAWNGVTLPDTPTDTGIPVLDVARWGDKFANPEGLSDIKARGIHCNYFGVSLDPVEAMSSHIEGGTTFVVTQ